MVDERQAEGGSTALTCPWCSAPYDDGPENCPTCGATLAGDGAPEGALPGLTAVDASAIVRAKQPPTQSRNRLLSWISGEYPEDSGAPGDAGALAPPDPDVRREILRLELEAEVANLQAEAGALMAEATVEGRAPDASPEDVRAAQAVVQQLALVSSELQQTGGALETASARDLATDVEPAVGSGSAPLEPGPEEANRS